MWNVSKFKCDWTYFSMQLALSHHGAIAKPGCHPATTAPRLNTTATHRDSLASFQCRNSSFLAGAVLASHRLRGDAEQCLTLWIAWEILRSRVHGSYRLSAGLYTKRGL